MRMTELGGVCFHVRPAGIGTGQPYLVSMSAALKSSGNPRSEPTKAMTGVRVDL